MGEATKPPGLAKSVVLGAVGLALVSVAAYSLWIVGGRWGDAALYAAIAAAYLALSAFVLHPLAGGRLRFFLVFAPAFLAYAAAWCAVWFATKSRPGEWGASAAGSLAFVLVVAAFRGAWRAVPLAALILFMAHSAGYFAGSYAFFALKAKSLLSAMLLWGFLHGLGFGAGIGDVFFRTRRAPN